MEIANDLGERMDQGEWLPGVKFPSTRELSQVYGVKQPVIRDALGVLEGWGYIHIRAGARAVVLDRTAPKTMLKIGQSIGRNDEGYFYNPAAADWSPVGVPDRAWVSLTRYPEVATRLGIVTNDLVLARHRVVGPGGIEPAQTTTTYIVDWLGRQLDVADTGPGGWIDYVEQHLELGPVRWKCAVSSRRPLPHEAHDLGLGLSMPVLVLSFTITARGRRQPIAIDVMTFDASKFEVEHTVTRSAEAKWPVKPATKRNLPVSNSN